MAEPDLTTHLRSALTAALKDRRRDDARVLRSALAAIANAEAVADGDVIGDGSAHVAGSAAGVGAADIPRRELDAAAVTRIVEQEIHERLVAAEGHERLGRTDDAARLRSEADLLRAFVG